MPVSIETSTGELKETLERVSLVRAALSVNQWIGYCAIGECSKGVAKIVADMRPNDDFTRHRDFETEEVHAMRHMINGPDNTFDLRMEDGVPNWVVKEMPQFDGVVGGVVDHLKHVGRQIASHALHRVGLIEVTSFGLATVPEATHATVAYERGDIRSEYDRAVFDLVDADRDWQQPREFTGLDLEADGYYGVYAPHAARHWWEALDEDLLRHFPSAEQPDPAT